jgi:hypothetical protein
LCVLDWTKTTKERAFSSEHRPVVVQAWTPYKSSDYDMGMVQFKVDQATNHNTTTPTPTTTPPTLLQKASEYDPWGHVRISWVTVSGWLLSTVMESPTLHGDCQVLHTPPKVEYRTADGDVVDTTTTTTTSGSNNNTKAKRTRTTTTAYSLPPDPMRADTTTSSSQLMVWSDVPAVTKILPHHNKYVLDAQPKVTRPNQRALLMRHLQQERSTNTTTISTSTCSRTQSIPLLAAKTPQAIAVHPGLEWMVLGVDHRLVLMVGRGH